MNDIWIDIIFSCSCFFSRLLFTLFFSFFFFLFYNDLELKAAVNKYIGNEIIVSPIAVAKKLICAPVMLLRIESVHRIPYLLIDVTSARVYTYVYVCTFSFESRKTDNLNHVHNVYNKRTQVKILIVSPWKF